MSAFKDLKNKVFGELTVIARSRKRHSTGAIMWYCRCSCGKQLHVRGGALTLSERPTRSCGCIRLERAIASRKTHGATFNGKFTTEYSTWHSMIQRCHNPNNEKFPDYGGRGIVVCEQWRNSFEQFLKDMGYKPNPKLTIDRRDNNKGYEPGNCYWATRAEQQKNRRNARLITLNGRTETAHMWSKILGIPSRTIHNRLTRGLTPEEILFNGKLSH